MEHAMGAAMRVMALVLFFLIGLGSGPMAAQANPPPPANYPPPNAPPPANQPPPPAAAPQSQNYSSNEVVDAGHRFFGSVSRGLAQIVEKAGSQWGLPN